MFSRLLVFSLLLLACRVGGAGPLPCGTIKLAFYELGALYYLGADGNWAGIDKDVVDELARRTGCRFDTVLESRVRIWTQLSAGVLDMSVSGIATPEREQFARFLPYFVTRNYALLARDLPQEASGMHGFLSNPAYRVAVVKSFKHGADYDKWLDLLRAQGRVHEVADFRSVIRLIKTGRVHAGLALSTSWVTVLREEGMRDKVRIEDWSPGDRIVHGLVVSRSRIPDEKIELLARAIGAMRSDGTLLAIFRRHVGDEQARELIDY